MGSSLKIASRFLLWSLFSSIFIAPVSNAASDTTLLTICTSLRTDHQYISASGKCNERIYEKSTWYEPGMAPSGTSGSKTVSITLCTSKSRSNLRILAKDGRSCNRNSQTQSIFQRPLGPPATPELVSVIADTLGTAIITMKAPLEDGGARIRSYEVIEVGSTTPANKALATIATSFPIKAQQSTKISGLIPGQSYRFAIRANNAIGASPLTQSSAVFFAPTLPDAPSITSAVTSSYHSAQITFSPAPSDGGSPVTSYTITALPGRLQSTFLATDAKSHTFTGLSASTSYTFTIQATNIAGSGRASAPSNQITTFAPPPPPEPAAPTPSPSQSSSAPALASPAFTLSSSSETRTVNTAATGFTISSTGGAIASFAISATPAGMSFNATTGALTGTPTTVAGATAYTITATNASGSATQTFTLTVSPGAATKAMMTTQPLGAVSGSAFTTQPVVRVTDSGDNTVTSFTGNVVASISSGTGTLSGTTTATAVAGVATFTNLVITGTGDHVLTFTPETLTAVNSETLTVSLAAQATLSITSLTTNTKAHPYSQALSITTSGGSGTGATTFAIASGGTATTCTLSNSTATATITATTVGTCLIQATKAADATYASTTSATATFTFQVGSATKAMMTTQPSGAVNGSAFTTQPVVRVTDSGDNTVTLFTGNVVASIASGSGTLSGTTTVAAVDGVATFTNLVITGTAGNFTLTFTPASLTAVTSSSFALAAGAATKVAITRASVGTTDNVAFTTQPQITIQDSSGNTVLSSAVVTATISADSLIGTTTATASSGVATFTGLGIDGTSGTTYTITYTVSGLTVATATVTLAASNGINWTSRTSAADRNWNSVTYGNGLFVAVTADEVAQPVMTSPDGITWTSRGDGIAYLGWRGVTYGNGLFVAVGGGGGRSGRLMRSTNGITWTDGYDIPNQGWSSVTYGNGIFVAVASSGGTSNRVMTSRNGITWTNQSFIPEGEWSSVTYGNGLFVAVASSGAADYRVMTSPDGFTWTARNSATNSQWSSVTYGNGTFVAVATSGTGKRVMTSPDGITWTSRNSTNDSYAWSVTFGNSLFVAVSYPTFIDSGGRVMTSPDGITWTSRNAATNNYWSSVTYGNGTFVAVATSGTGNRVMTSTP